MAAYFDGSASIGNLVSSGLSSRQALIHAWLNLRRVNHTGTQYVYTAVGVNIWLRVSTTNYIQAGVRNGAADAIASLASIEPLTLGTGWVPIDFVVDNQQGFAKLYVSLALVASATPSVPADPLIDHDSSGNIIGARSGTTDSIVAGIDQVLVANAFTSDYVTSRGVLTPRYLAEFYDFDPDGVPHRKQTSLAAGAGAAPYILCENPAATFRLNNGTLGDFTLTGSLSEPDPAVPTTQWVAT